MAARPLQPSTPEYGDAAAWLCRPPSELAPLPAARLHVSAGPRGDGSGAAPARSPSGLAHAEQPEADCFWVHPTLEHGGATSNRLLSSPMLLQWTLGQASAFSGAAAIHAPYYRQMVLGCDGFLGVYRAASALAFSDVRAAFVAYLAQSGQRPFFLAGHSQGAAHVLGLLREFFAGDGAEARALRRRLVGCYPIGNVVPAPQDAGGAELPGLPIPVSTGPGQVGVLTTWQTTAEDGELSDSLTGSTAARHAELQGRAPLAVNPLSWRADEAECDASSCDSLGRWLTGEKVVYDGIIGGTVCRGGLLKVLRVRDAYMKHYRTDPKRPKDYHSMDVHLFWGALRVNAEAQLAAWKAREGF